MHVEAQRQIDNFKQYLVRWVTETPSPYMVLMALPPGKCDGSEWLLICWNTVEMGGSLVEEGGWCDGGKEAEGQEEEGGGGGEVAVAVGGGGVQG
jgi:hypothetical protein